MFHMKRDAQNPDPPPVPLLARLNAALLLPRPPSEISSTMAFRPSASFLSPLRLPLASSSRSLRPPPCLLSTPSSSQQLGRRAVFSMVSQPKQDVVVDGQIGAFPSTACMARLSERNAAD